MNIQQKQSGSIFILLAFALVITVFVISRLTVIMQTYAQVTHSKMITERRNAMLDSYLMYAVAHYVHLKNQNTQLSTRYEFGVHPEHEAASTLVVKIKEHKNGTVGLHIALGQDSGNKAEAYCCIEMANKRYEIIEWLYDSYEINRAMQG